MNIKESYNFCPFRIKTDSNQKFNNVIFPVEIIPQEGMCQTTRRPCEYPFMGRECKNADPSLIGENRSGVAT